MKNFQLLLIFAPAIMSLACSSSDRPMYGLTDSLLHSVNGGDSNTYAVLDANTSSGQLSSYTETLETKTLFAPDNSSMVVYLEAFSQNGELTYPFVSRLFSQDEQGNLQLLGISRSGEYYWLMADSLTDVGQIFLPNDLSTLQSPLQINSALKYCENQICETKGQITVVLKPLGIEKVETNYADFETYKYSLQWDISLYDSDNANNSINQSLIEEGSRQWIHPAIGVVKFIYEINSDLQFSTLFGNLTQTNISIPERYKK